jgi:FKBP-type peptidyl-prolyl cis-trans isomerase 2
MVQAKVGDRVKVRYSGSSEHGTIFGYSSLEEHPLTFTIGEKRVLPGFENAVIGMCQRETKTVSLPPEDAYSHFREDLIFLVEKSSIPPDINLELRDMLEVTLQDETIIIVNIQYISEELVTFDGNDPLIGEKLNFKIELLEIL